MNLKSTSLNPKLTQLNPNLPNIVPLMGFLLAKPKLNFPKKSSKETPESPEEDL